MTDSPRVLQEKGSAPVEPGRSLSYPGQPSRIRAHGPVLVLALLLTGLYVGSSFGPVIWDEIEGQYTGAAREMWRSGDWMVPSNNGIPRLNKPPVFYWAILASFAAVDMNEFGARLPNALATLLWLFSVYLVAWEIGGARLARRAVCVLGTTFGFFIFCHIIGPEALMAAFLTLVFWTFLRALHDPAHASSWLLGAWVFMALGSLTKGLHGAAYPLAIAGIAVLLRAETRPVFRKLIRGPGPLLFLFLLVPWYAYIELRYPGFLRDNLLNEQLGHVFNKRWPPDSSQVPLIPFLLEHGILFLPWVMFVPAMIQVRSKRLQALEEGKTRADIALLWIWPALTLGSVLFSARQDYYTLTCWGALAVLFARALPGIRGLSAVWRVAPPAVLAASGLALLIGSFMVRATLADSAESTLPAEQRPHAYETVRGFSPRVWGQLAGPMAGAGAALLISGSVAVPLARRSRMEGVTASLAIGMFGLLAVVPRGLSVVEDYLSLAPAAKVINQRAEPEAWVVYQGEPHRASSLFFYLDRPVRWIDSVANQAFVPRVLGIGRDLFLTSEQFTTAWRSARPIYFITEDANLSYWQEHLGLSARALHPVARSGTRVVLLNSRP